MQMETEFARTIDQNPLNPELDATAKKFISNKYLLAWIMKGCVEEYKDCTIEEIVEHYIEGEPQVAATPVHRDESGVPMLVVSDETEESKGTETELIHGLDTVDKSTTEHTTLYDVLFYATLPNSAEKIGLFINVEIQNQYNLKYPLVKRGIYYCSRLISAQFQRDFADGDYGKLKKVYSIWICADAPDNRDNTITRYSMTEEQLLGTATEDRKNYDLMTVVMVCFNDRHIYNENATAEHTPRTGEAPADMVRLLRLLLTSNNGSAEKKQVLSEEYNIPMTRELEDEVIKMCNLSQGIREQGIQIGLQQGLQQGELAKAISMALKMLKKNKSIEEIIEFTELTLEQLKQIAEENGLELVTE